MLRITRTYPKLALVLIVFLFAVIVASMVISGSLSAAAIRKEVTASNLMFLNKLDRQYGNELEHINSVLNDFCQDYLNDRDLGTRLEDQYERYLLYNKIDNLLQNNRFLQSVCIYLNHGRDVYHQSTKLTEWERADGFGDAAFYRTFMATGQLSQVTGVRSVNEFLGAEAQMAPVRVITCAKRLPMLYFGSEDALVFNVYADYLAELAGSGFQADEAGILLLDSQDGVLISCSQSTGSPLALSRDEMASLLNLAAGPGESFSASVKIGGERQFVIGYKSASGRTGIVMTREELMLLPVAIVNRTLMIVAACLFAFGILFSALVDRRYFQPVQRILRLVVSEAGGQAGNPGPANKPGKPANEFRRIENYIGQLEAKNREQEKQLQSYFTHYRMKALQMLVGSEGEAREALADERLFFRENKNQYCVVLTCPIRQTAQVPAGEADDIRNYPESLAETLGAIGRVDIVEKSRRGATLLFSAETIESAGAIREYIQELCPPGRCGCSAALGGVSDCLASIHESFAGAERVLHRVRECGRAGAFVEDDLEAMAREKAGGHETGARRPVPAPVDARSFGSDNVELIGRVKNYIAEHYMEDIGLNTIADYVYFSPSYLGKLFKDISGYSFTDYIIKVRMEAAASLLLGTNLKMNEVMKRVGYFSVQGFSRVFKSHFNCSPGEYRKKAACDALDADGAALEQVSSQ